MTEFFRHCPNCGRRFHIELESKKLVGGHREEFSGAAHRSGSRILIDIDEYQNNYKCKICGHEWSEKRVEDEPE